MEFYFAIPSITSLKKLLIIFLFLINILVIVLFWFSNSNYYIQNPDGGNIYIAFGRIFGLLGEYFLLVQLVLVGRIRTIEHLFGFDKLNFLHRWIGYSILGLLISHPIFLVVGNAIAIDVSYISQFADFLANKKDVFKAFIALSILIFIVFLSIAIVRKKLRYETWYFTHLLTYLAIGLAFKHQLGTGDLRRGWALYYWYVINFGVFGAILLYRFIRPFYRFLLHRFVIEKVVQESYDTWSLYITGRNMNLFRFDAGQYANITILARGAWYTHPFSLSSAFNGTSIRFSIKALGDYTKKIRDLKPGTYVIIDGPLGLFVEKRAERDKYLFIAGGIGITPIRAMLESLAKNKKDAILLYAVKSVNDMVFKKELDEISASAPTIKINYILSAPALGYESGYIDKEKIVRLVPDFFAREVFLCGPPPMMKVMVKTLKELGFPSRDIHFEKFSF